MKRTVFILAMLLIASTSFSQSNRRTTNTEKPAQQNTRVRTEANKEKTSGNQKSSEQINRSRTQTQSGDAEKNREARTTSTQTRVKQDVPENKPRERTDNNRTQNPNTNSESRPERNSSVQRDERHHVSTERQRETTRQTTVRRETHAAHTVPHKDYSSPRVYRESHVVSHYYHRPPESRSYRSRHYIYRAPVDYRVVWTPVMHRRYLEIYPMIRVWYYPTGYRIETISSYDADYYRGEVMNVYGQINEIFYSRTTDEYFLYFGPYYPYQDFTVVIPGWIARKYNPQPTRFFENQYMIATGLITDFEEIPEIVVKDPDQINLY